MLWISLDRWSSSHGSIFSLYRYYYQGRWTPLCKVHIRYLRTLVNR